VQQYSLDHDRNGSFRPISPIEALATLKARNNLQLRSFPADLVGAARTTANDVLGDLAGKSLGAQKVHDSYVAFRDKVAAWSRISTQAVLEARGG
jgi:TRAP-type mannitol/chloroaromatic compound transport system substrate-binding protein